MPIVNYVREHIRFMEYATDEHLTSSERLLWYALMHIMNQRAQGRLWPDEFIRISNDRLLSYCPMKYDTLSIARNSLKQRGLIEFTKGEKNKKSPAYRMIYFYPEYAAPDTERDGEACYTEKSYYTGGNTGGNRGYNSGGNTGDNIGGNTGDIYINYTSTREKRNPYRNPNVCEEDDEEEERRADARAEAQSAWKDSFGETANPATVNRLVLCATTYEFEHGVLERAIQCAAIKNARSPVDYILSLLRDWAGSGVKTQEDADEYAFAYDAAHGKITGMSAEEGARAMQAFCKDRETPEQRERREAQEAEDEEARRKRREMIEKNGETRMQTEYREKRERLDEQRKQLDEIYANVWVCQGEI